ncbi:hypothetical protein ACJW30_06G197300 [Castanea mollissima]
MMYEDIDQIGSCFSKDVFDPHGYDKSDYYFEIVYEFDDDTKDEAKYEDYDDSDVDDSDKYHGDDDGYDEDDDDDGEGSDDKQVEDLETKIEDFIAKGHKQWREELMHDQKFHCMAATELQ